MRKTGPNKISLIVVILVLSIAFIGKFNNEAYAAGTSVSVYFSNFKTNSVDKINFPTAQPYEKNGVIYIPVEDIVNFENNMLGFEFVTIEHMPSENKYVITQGLDSKAFVNIVSGITVGNSEMKRDFVEHGNRGITPTTITLSGAPEIVDGKLMLPVNGVRAALGALIDFYSLNNTVYIKMTAQADPEDEADGTRYKVISDELPEFNQAMPSDKPIAPKQPVAPATNAITVEIDGKALNFDVPAQIVNGRTMVPMRKIFEALGATVSWNDTTKTIISTRGSDTIVMQINSKVMTVNGKALNPVLDVPPMIMDGRTLVPVRAVADALGCKVDWNGTTRLVSISTKTQSESSGQQPAPTPSPSPSPQPTPSPTPTPTANKKQATQIYNSSESAYPVLIISNQLYGAPDYIKGRINVDGAVFHVEMLDENTGNVIKDMGHFTTSYSTGLHREDSCVYLVNIEEGAMYRITAISPPQGYSFADVSHYDNWSRMMLEFDEASTGVSITVKKSNNDVVYFYVLQNEQSQTPTPKPTPSPVPTPSPTPNLTQEFSIEELRQQLFDLVNVERSKVGAPNVAKNEQLMQVAQVRAEAMAQQKVQPDDHYIPGLGSLEDTMSAYNARGHIYISENLTWTNTPENAIAMWLASKAGHRENMLDQLSFGGQSMKWNNIGVGVAWDSNGLGYWVLVFSK